MSLEELRALRDELMAQVEVVKFIRLPDGRDAVIVQKKKPAELSQGGLEVDQVVT